ncbi:MAG: zinc-binding dehydrogenase [Halopseudomonas aestusnigri]
MALPETMSGVQLTRHGGPETLVWSDDIPVRKPGAGEVLVRVRAAGVNNTDINTRIGWYSSAVTNSTADVDPDAEIENGGWSGALPFPVIQGGDICGEIVALGDGVKGFEIGMRITSATVQAIPTADEPTKFVTLGSEYDGAFAQYCTLPADQVFDVSTSPLSDQEIAALPCAFGTAMGLLTRAHVSAGDRVLITGASGGVGMAAVQLAKLRGAKITGIASPAKQADVLAAGANDVIARGDIPQAQSYNVVIDLVGGHDWPHFINALKPSGRYAVSGAIAGPIVAADLRTIYLNDLTLLGSTYQPKEVFAELVELINQGQIKPLISKTYPLSDIATAQEDFISKQYPGKLVLIPPQ